MKHIAIEQLQPAELRQAIEVVARAFSTQPNIMAILGERDRKRRVVALFRIALERLPGQVLVAKKGNRIVGVMRMVEWPQCQVSPLQGLKASANLAKRPEGCDIAGSKT